MTTDQIINSIAAVSTAGALVYTLLKDINTRKEVKDLKVLSEELVNANKLAGEANAHLAEQNLLQKKMMAATVAPNLNFMDFSPNGAHFDFKILNLGGKIFITNIDFESEGSALAELPYPVVINADDDIYLRGILYSRNEMLSQYYKLFYDDVYGNEYTQEIRIIDTTIYSEPPSIVKLI